MKNRWTLAAAAMLMLALSLAGCKSNVNRDLNPRAPVNKAQRSSNEAMVQSYQVDHITSAVIRQHTLYPYHFVPDSASLNELGWRDVNLLASHYLANPGPLNVRMGDTAEVLYKARIKTIVEAMNQAGVKTDRIKVSDGLPGGDGITADQVVIIMEKMKQKGAKAGAQTGESVSADGDANRTQSDGIQQPTNTGARTGGQY